ncbi:MAG: hypothetical protein AAB074_01350 [Planctomycetota bacterium]
MRRVPVLTGIVAALIFSPAMAYGRYQHTDTTGMVLETVSPFIRIILMSLVPYLACSLWMERTKGGGRILALLVNLAVAGIVVMPNLFVLGEYGPAHVALSAAGGSCIAFPALLIGKLFVLSTRKAVRETPSAVPAPTS